MERVERGQYRAADLGRDGWAVATRQGATFVSGLTEREAMKLAGQLNTAFAVGYAAARDDIRRVLEQIPLPGARA